MDKTTILQDITTKFNAMATKLGLGAKVVELNKVEKIVAFKKGDENLKPEKFEEVILQDGVTVATIEPAVEVGAAIVIMDSEGNPIAAPVGEYILQDGRTVVVAEDGVVAEVREAIAEEPMKEDSKTESTGVNPKQVIERIETEKIFERVKELESKISEQDKMISFLKAETETFKKELVDAQAVNVESFKKLLSEPSKEPVQKKKITTIQEFKQSDEDSVMDAWLAKHNNKN